jgi:hypothetical protein
MTSQHERAARYLAKMTGQPYTRMRNLTAHRHPIPDLAPLLEPLPYACGRPVEVEFAATVIGACRAGCRPCQDSLVPGLYRHRPTVATLAGAIYGMWPTAGPLASPPTRTWHPIVRHAQHRGDGTAALAAVDAMTEAEVAELVNDALDHWSVAAANVTFHTITLDDDQPEPAEHESGPPSYQLMPGVAESSLGPIPCLVLAPETPGADVQDLRRRTQWQPWDTTKALPEADTAWRVRIEIATRSLAGIVHVDDTGYDDVTLWTTEEIVPLPQEWFDLVDHSEHVLLCGPAASSRHEDMEQASAAGELLAVIARVRFW